MYGMYHRSITSLLLMQQFIASAADLWTKFWRNDNHDIALLTLNKWWDSGVHTNTGVGDTVRQNIQNQYYSTGS